MKQQIDNIWIRNGRGVTEMGRERQHDSGRSKVADQKRYRFSEFIEKYIWRYLRMTEKISEIFPDTLFWSARKYYYHENLKIFDKEWSQNTSVSSVASLIDKN
jgi:hypothetical protein